MSEDYELLPNKLEIVLYLVITGIIVIGGNFTYFAAQLLRETGATKVTVGNMLGDGLDKLLDFVDNLSLTPTAAVFIFWCLAGIAVFTFLEASYSVYKQLKDDLDVSTHFLHPSNYSNKRFWLGVLYSFLLRTMVFALAALWSLVIAFILVPVGITFSLYFFADISARANLFSFMAASVLLYIGVLVMGVVLKLLLTAHNH